MPTSTIEPDPTPDPTQRPPGSHRQELQTAGPAPVGVKAVALRVANAISRTRGVLRQLSPEAIALLLLALVTAFGIALAHLGGEIYEWVFDEHASKTVDAPVLEFMVTHRTSGLNDAVTGFTHLGGPVGFPVVACAIVALLVWRTRSVHRALVLILGTVSALSIIVFGKELTQRSRPDVSLAVPPFEHSPSFPSGHTLNSTVFAALVLYTCWNVAGRRSVRTVLATLCALWALGMGLSRVYLGHHWLTDVLAGWAFGLAWAMLVIAIDYIFVLLRARRREHRDRLTAEQAAVQTS